ncbi:MAG: UDP-N-acetylmuramoyl-L-alanine--D-glutamate ligase [Candidatus Nitrospinota bacterium M3_3B_026]
MADYKNRKALVIGLARTGLSAARLLDDQGAHVTVTDLRSEESLGEFCAALPEKTKKFLGGHEGVPVLDYDLAVISPGVPWDAPLPSALREAGVELVSEIELSSTLISAPIIAVTGSNGKSTTTALTGEMLKKAGKRTYVGGNIGAPLADAAGGDYDWVVAEVSSFQLEGVKTFRPRIGLILNITPDHIDRHGTMAAYAALKNRIYENQGEGDTLILNAGAPLLKNIMPPTGARILRFGRDPMTGEGAWVEEGMAVAEFDGERVNLFSLGEMRIKGPSNVENALAASLAALAAGAGPGAIREAVAGFEGLPHRMERVAEVDGVVFINDSKGTNVDATVKSLSGFDNDVVLIAGGSSKGADFGPLASAMRKHAKGVVLIGATAQGIEKALGGFEPVRRAKDMEVAVAMARQMAAPGDTILLSPACASFDMFKNYEQRGEAFGAAVRSLEMSEKLRKLRNARERKRFGSKKRKGKKGRYGEGGEMEGGQCR